MSKDIPASLHEKFKYWRKTKNNFRLHEAKDLLGLSVSYISDLENGKEEVSKRVFRAYHAADPDLFPLTDANLML